MKEKILHAAVVMAKNVTVLKEVREHKWQCYLRVLGGGCCTKEFSEMLYVLPLCKQSKHRTEVLMDPELLFKGQVSVHLRDENENYIFVKNHEMAQRMCCVDGAVCSLTGYLVMLRVLLMKWVFVEPLNGVVSFF